MKPDAIVNLLMYAEPVACLGVILFMRQRKLLENYKVLAIYLLTRVAGFAIMYPLLHFCGTRIEKHLAYHLYFYSYWTIYTLQALLGFAVIWSIYHLAMAPLRGLQRLGRLMFRWAAGIAIAISVSMMFGPHVSGLRFVIKLITQIQQTESVLTLCLMLFVCLAIQPMGLSPKSKIFGVSLGLGVLATSGLVSSAWLASGPKMASTFNIVNGVAILSALAIWVAYFAIPEPKRRMIVLPTTSPFLRWNQISIALGDEPGYVALGEVGLDQFAPAEVEIMRRASLKMADALQV